MKFKCHFEFVKAIGFAFAFTWDHDYAICLIIGPVMGTIGWTESDW